MSWETFNAIAIWACALGSITCAVAATWLANVNRHAHAATMTALNEMSDTYKQSWAIVCEDLNQLRDRIAELENR